ncbi:MAG: glycosyltransferase [Patescibacteria group bacterium]|nr:glycosyltransferase [Patescibacteria group bacterium]
MKISVVIPAYNEEEGIEKTIKKIPKEVFEIIIVDNNSTDKTAEIAKNLGARVVKEHKQGYGYALQRGFKEAKGDIIVTLDADGQYPGEKIIELSKYLEENDLDFLNCSRFPLQNKNSLPAIRIFGNIFLTFITNILFNIRTKDSLSGMMIFKKEILNRFKLEEWDLHFSQELKIKALESGVKYEEVNIPYYPRVGESKLFPIKNGLKSLFFLLKLKFNQPKTNLNKKVDFFLILSLLSIFLSLASLNVNKPFINVTSDQNGETGVAVLNWLNTGLVNMKFGKLVSSYVSEENFNFEQFKNSTDNTFYTNHPVFYLLYSYFLLKLFGPIEITVRGGILLIFIISLIFFYLSLRRIFNSYIPPLLISLVFIILPGTIYYGTTSELAAFSLPHSLISFSLFVFYFFTKKELYFYLLLGSIILGGLMGWFYFFMPLSIWIYLLFNRDKNFENQRKKLLILIPLVSVIIFIFNFLHIYILRGNEGLIGVKNAFFGRASRAPLDHWLPVVYSRAQLNFNDLFLWLSMFGLLLFIFKFRNEYKIITPLILMPIFNALVFFQWSTHPFGVIFFLPIVAFFSFLTLRFIYENIKTYGLVVIVILLAFGFYLSYNKLDFLINKFLILGEKDVLALKQLKNELKDNEVCLGQNQMGLYYGGITMWYLRKNIYLSPKCLEDENKIKDLKLAIVFHPQLGNFYAEEVNRFLSKGFKPIGCADLWCFLAR